MCCYGLCAAAGSVRLVDGRCNNYVWLESLLLNSADCILDWGLPDFVWLYVARCQVQGLNPVLAC
jgi:hypothetical protein